VLADSAKKAVIVREGGRSNERLVLQDTRLRGYGADKCEGGWSKRQRRISYLLQLMLGNTANKGRWSRQMYKVPPMRLARM